MRTHLQAARSVGHVAALMGLALAVACHSESVSSGDMQSAEAGVSEVGAVASSCVARDDGEICGEAQHCFGQRCAEDQCGDGILSPSEECDDGNRRWGDGCGLDCELERPGCPDGTQGGDEECDDGNWIDDDACSNLCQLRAVVCGNGQVEAGEDCDDGNTVDDDQCPNQCQLMSCRDGAVDPGEECDDGNSVDKDGCTNQCKISVCGNGKIEKYETCDDGNRVDSDACPNDCIASVCGNGVVEARGGEVCDTLPVFAVGVGRKGCSADCKSLVDDACNRCLDQRCRAYFEPPVSVLGSCFLEVDPQFGAVADKDFLSDCTRLVACAVRNHCGLHDERERALGNGVECYCGSNGLDACTTEGPTEDAPCLSEWLRATRAEDNAEVQIRFSDLAYPAGWAYFLLQCMTQECPRECVPPKASMSAQ